MQLWPTMELAKFVAEHGHRTARIVVERMQFVGLARLFWLHELLAEKHKLGLVCKPENIKYILRDLTGAIINYLTLFTLAATATACGSRLTTALNPWMGSAVYSTVRRLPSGSINEYDPWTTSPERVSCWFFASPVNASLKRWVFLIENIFISNV